MSHNKIENVINFLTEFKLLDKDNAPPVEKVFTDEFTG
jgi:hypothetical protein